MSEKTIHEIHDAANQALRLPRLKSLTVFHVEMMPGDKRDGLAESPVHPDDLEDSIAQSLRRSLDAALSECEDLQEALSQKTLDNERLDSQLSGIAAEYQRHEESLKKGFSEEIKRLQEVIDYERKETDKIAQVSIDRKIELDDLKVRMAEMERKCATNDSISQSLDSALAACEELQGNLGRERKECARLRTEGDGYYKRIQDLSAKMLCIRACCEELSKKEISEEVRESISKIWHLA